MTAREAIVDGWATCWRHRMSVPRRVGRVAGALALAVGLLAGSTFIAAEVAEPI